MKILNLFFLIDILTRNFLESRKSMRGWTWRDVDISHPIQTDDVSCGVYVLKVTKGSKLTLYSHALKMTLNRNSGPVTSENMDMTTWICLQNSDSSSVRDINRFWKASFDRIHPHQIWVFSLSLVLEWKQQQLLLSKYNNRPYPFFHNVLRCDRQDDDTTRTTLTSCLQ